MLPKHSQHFTTLLLVSVLGASPALLAAEAAPTGKAPEAQAENTGWTGNVSFGINNTTGNVETQSGNVGLQLNRETLPWRYRIAAKANAMDVQDTRISESYLADFQADYVLPNKNYWFGYTGYDSNKFARLDQRFVEIAGYGMKVLETPKQTLGLEAGLGARQSKYTENLGKENEGIGHLGADYNLQLTDNTTLTENFVYQPGAENNFIMSDTALKVAMSKKTSIELSYGYTNNSKVFPNTKKTDTTSGVNLVIGF
jgi:putative salt-induced outer membrane protein